MMGLPVHLLDGAGVVAVVVIVGWMVFTGRLITRREADAKDRQIMALQRTLAAKDETISDFKEVIATSNALIQAVLEVAKERSP